MEKIKVDAKNVKSLLRSVPVRESSCSFQTFYGLSLIRKDGLRFTLSIQGSECHYCSPRECLPSLMDYNTVEIGIIPESRRGWFQPEDIGFRHIKSDNDDVIGFASMTDLIRDLVEFFEAGGAIDADSEDTLPWIWTTLKH